EDTVADLQRGDIWRQGLDHAGEFRRRRERERWLGLIFPGNDQRIEEIECRRLDADDDFAGPGRGVGDVGKFKIVRSAVMGTKQGFYGGCLTRRRVDLAPLTFGL